MNGTVYFLAGHPRACPVYNIRNSTESIQMREKKNNTHNIYIYIYLNTYIYIHICMNIIYIYMIHKPFSAGMGKDRAPFISPLLLAYVQPLSPSHRWDILARKLLILAFLWFFLFFSTHSYRTFPPRTQTLGMKDVQALQLTTVVALPGWLWNTTVK